MSHRSVRSPRRRALLLGSLSAPALALGGCATTRFPDPPIDGEAPTGLRPILAPGPVTKAPGAPPRVIDVHGHFFNARDVPVAGYLRGPVAHSKGGLLGDLIEALAGHPGARCRDQRPGSRAHRAPQIRVGPVP